MRKLSGVTITDNSCLFKIYKEWIQILNISFQIQLNKRARKMNGQFTHKEMKALKSLHGKEQPL